MSRGSGTTTAAMLAAPQGAVYVWVNGRLDYPCKLARSIGRSDLTIVSPGWFNGMDWHYYSRYSGIVLDHATVLTDRQYDAFKYVSDIMEKEVT